MFSKNKVSQLKLIIALGLVLLLVGPGHIAAAQFPPTTRVIVVLRPHAAGQTSAQRISQTQDELLDELPPQDFEVVHQFSTLPGLVGEVSEAGLITLRNRPDVVAIAPDLPVYAVLGESTAFIKANVVWQALGVTGAGINVAVLDTGVDINHPDLNSSVIAQQCFNKNDTCPSDNSAQDENGHGTHVAGIIAGNGTVTPPGVAPDAGLAAVRVLDKNGSGYTSDVLAGIDWVVANQESLHVKIINMSLGGGSYAGNCDDTDANTMLYAAAVESARQAGITLFAAAGNSGETENMIAPACVSNVVSVGNVYDTPLDTMYWPSCTDSEILADQVACSSNSSPTLDLLAPGTLITSTGLNGGQSIESGTSMSTPHAAGVAVLMLQAGPQLSPAEVETILKETGRQITDTRTDRVTPRVDALAAVSRVTSTEPDLIFGTVLLQGRTIHSGTKIFTGQSCTTVTASTVATSTTPAAVTEEDGNFQIASTAGQSYHCLQVAQPGYLAAQHNAPVNNLGTITLPAGDLNNDGTINILDLALIAQSYKSDNPVADVDANGLVDIFDLVLAAQNFKLTGPIEWAYNE